MRIVTLKKHCVVGKYEFDICVDRNMVLNAYKNNEKYWLLQNKVVKNSSKFENTENLNIDNVKFLADLQDELFAEIPKVVRYILPEMVDKAESTLDVDEFLKYCEEQNVEQLFYEGIIEFLNLGFTNGKIVKEPKVEVKFN